MRRFLAKLSFLLLCLAALTCALFFAAAYLIPDMARFSYISVAVERKHRSLKTAFSPKIIVMSGSSSLFGLNQYLLEELTGLPTVNLGLYAGLGFEFIGYLAKTGIEKGDLVVLGYEYGVKPFGHQLVAVNGSSMVEMTRYLSKPSYADLVMFLPEYVLARASFLVRADRPADDNPVYLASSFDKRGQMILPRNDCIYENPIPWETVEKSAQRVRYSDEILTYFNSMGEYASERGATVLLTFPPLFDEMTASDAKEIAAFQKEYEETLRVPVISRIQDYIFDRRYIFDSPYHCNSVGEEKRTRLLARDINRYLAEWRDAP